MVNIAFAALLAGLAGTALAAEHTNVVFILTDDQGAWSLGCYGNSEARTPGVDHLAAEGIRFTRAFATIPVCSPSRATFFTGRIASQHGIHDWIKHENMGSRARVAVPEEDSLLSAILARQGYTCGLVGKWHLGDSARPHAGYTYWFSLLEGSSEYNNAEMIWEGKPTRTKGYLTDRITDKALDFLQSNKDRPFFLTVTYNAPHSPYRGHPAELVELFRDCPFNSIPRLPTHPWSTSKVEKLRTHQTLSQYFAACSAVSRGVERIARQLDDLGLSGNTLVVYASDQGYCCGHHGLWGKGNASNPRNIYDTSLQIPLIFRQPGRIPKGATTDALFGSYDFVPTVLAYLNLPPSTGRNLPGRSFVPAIKGQPWEPPDAVFAEYGRARMIRTATYKYVHRADGGPHELYDLQKDAGETTNLADQLEYRQRLVTLRTRLFKWFDKYAEAGRDPIGNEYLRPDDTN
ncbi:MAG TPA: sulfatase-like hydrolase/transferase [Phycisphaerae bacterium]|nr:sulfatase-like hydrolase/transferase [Phycisphaerae bacterium]HRY69024.1 sulfatase-like hydrolase/transferase [Phycisphaerae bacterium]HSA26001.1 sulfatase-like hydrolase/transferase [Phycisphaerae bacterium]